MFSSHGGHLCKLVNVKPSDLTSEAFVLLKEKLCNYYILNWPERIKNVQQNGNLLFAKANVWVRKLH